MPLPYITPSKSSSIKLYQSLCETQKNTIDLSRTQNQSSFRIATYNVHCWADVYNKPNFDNIFADIKDLDSDILCLQEVCFDKNQYNPHKYDDLIAKFKEIGYVDHVEVQGSWYLSSRYGNMIFSREAITNKRVIVLPIGQARVKRACCFGNIEKYGIEVCCVHLDVFDDSGETRRLQLAKLLKSIHDPKSTVICGDFNAMRASDYSRERLDSIIESDLHRGSKTDVDTLEILESHNYLNCFDHSSQKSPESTVWSGRAVDFIFANVNFIKKFIRSQVYYTIQSDHYALFADILLV
jgi:endonuclease/exonuclease/phosphatase family metal-dependent hydrolase